ncbi:MAG: S-layer homology domain-containing protein [Clostridia bacterium]|nr:S-layer homology domain-containing protein [Clostridia bacterium]
MFKKLTALLLAFNLMFCITAFAETSLTEQQIFELKAFSVVEGGEDGELRLDDNITRAEFTKIVSRLLNYSDEDCGIFPEAGFKDVPQSHWAMPYISLAVSLGLINGDGTGNFNPESYITPEQASKILVLALGFGSFAEDEGGYPSGYTSYAGKLGLYKGVDSAPGSAMKRRDVFKMVYNSLDADRLDPISYGVSGSAEVSDSTLRDFFLNEKTENILKIKGTVTADYKTFLGNPIPDMEPQQVEIGGVIYDKGSTNAGDYLGMEVEAYVRRESPDSSDYIIKEIKPVKDYESVSFPFNNLQSVSSGEISYYDGGSTRTIKKNISSAQFVYNGRLLSDRNDINIMSMTDGNIRLILSDSNTVKFVFINEYQSFVVDRVAVSAEDDINIFFANNKLLNGKGNILIGEENDVTYEIYDNDGQLADYDIINKDDLISVYVSGDGELVVIRVSTKRIEGTVTSLSSDENEVYIDSSLYGFEEGVDFSGLVGKNISAYVNFENKISYAEQGSGMSSYAGIVEILYSPDDENYNLRLVIPDILSDEIEETDSDDDYDDNEIPAISARNSGTLLLTLADKVSYDGSSCSDEEAVRKIRAQESLNGTSFLAISYRLDSEGKIKKIELPELYKQGNERTYNAYEKTFSDGKTNPDMPTVYGAFGLDSSTLAICVPDNGNEKVTRDDYLAKVEMNNKQDYFVEAYSYNNSTKCPELVLIHAPMVYQTAGSTDSKSDIGVVNGIVSAINDEDEEVRRVYIVTKDGEITADISEDTTSAADFDSLRSGDLIRYSLNWKDELDGFDILISALPVPESYYSNTDTDKVIFSGNISQVDYKEVSYGLNKWVNLVTMSSDAGDMVCYHVPISSAPPVFVVNSATGKTELGSEDDFVVSHKRAVVYASGISGGLTSVKAILIIE